MVVLPWPFTATRYPGYFWNTETQDLYSLKQNGILRKMKLRKPNPRFTGKLPEPYYCVSHQGHRRYLCISYLKGLQIVDSEIPMEKDDDHHTRQIRFDRSHGRGPKNGSTVRP